jgi:capsular polysaccharide transport system permease protein
LLENSHDIPVEVKVTRIEGTSTPAQSWKKGGANRLAIKRMLNVMHAVVLRDIRSRYFNHGLGFLIQPLLPVCHVLILLLIYNVTGRTAIFGDDLFLFFATGLVPALTFTYISRFMAVSLIMNKGMLAFPAVHLLDIVLARCSLEFVGIVISIIILFIILVSIGSNPYPMFPAEALAAIMSTVLLAIGVGIIVSVISAIFPFFAVTYSLFMVVVYLTAGGAIYLHMFPSQVVHICSYNPVFHSVEWVRSAYYLGYPAQDLDKAYLWGWGLATITIGLLMERYLKRFVLGG